jgi:predicted metal-dependent hydrolase
MDREGYERGIELFNRGEFFAAHEVLEDVWRPVSGEGRRFLQGLVQMAVALHHHSRGNAKGARSVLARAVRNLTGYPEEYEGIQVGELLAQARGWQDALDAGRECPSRPQITRR